MASSIRGTLSALAGIQAALTIAAPAALSLKRAYLTVPKQDAEPEVPCCINIPKLRSATHIASARQLTWEIRTQILAYDADQDRAAEIVLALLDAYLVALADAQLANNAALGVLLNETTSGDLQSYEYGSGGRRYPGIEVTTVWKVPLEAPPAVGP